MIIVFNALRKSLVQKFQRGIPLTLFIENVDKLFSEQLQNANAGRKNNTKRKHESRQCQSCSKTQKLYSDNLFP